MPHENADTGRLEQELYEPEGPNFLRRLTYAIPFSPTCEPRTQMKRGLAYMVAGAGAALYLATQTDASCLEILAPALVGAADEAVGIFRHYAGLEDAKKTELNIKNPKNSSSELSDKQTSKVSYKPLSAEEIQKMVDYQKEESTALNEGKKKCDVGDVLKEINSGAKEALNKPKSISKKSKKRKNIKKNHSIKANIDIGMI